MSALFYLQDSRGYVGNDVLWWAKGGNGYTTDLSKAEVYTREAAQAQHNMRCSDIPWPKAYIDGRTRPAVDMQYIKRDEALAGTGIEIQPEPKPHREQYRCYGCGRLMTLRNYYGGPCDHCHTDNWP